MKPQRRVFTVTMLALALPARAQAPARIAWISSIGAADEAANLEAFHAGMREQGLQDARHYVVDTSYADGKYERFPAMTAELIKRDPALIVVRTIASVRAAQQATKSIPILFITTNDPVGNGLVASLARPGGNTTGLSSQLEDFITKQVEFMREVLPRATRAAVLINPRNPSGKQLFGRVQAAATGVGITAFAFEAETPERLDAAFAAIAKFRPDALLMIGDAMLGEQRARISAFALKQRIPHFGTGPRYVESGSFMAYGLSLPPYYRRAAIYAKKLLAGVKPADLPVEQPTIFEMAVNLKTAKALGITVPYSILLRTDKVIE